MTPPYEPLPWQVAPLLDKSLVVLLTGSAGGGKSRCAAEKLHAFMLRYPGATGLVLRKAREFVNKSAVPMLWHSVIGGESSGVEMVKSDSLFRYKNGSMLWWGGMKDDDQREAIRSIGQTGGLDVVWLEEASAFTEQDFNEILGRMRGTAANWRQIILTTNPDAPNHHINQRLIVGRQAHVYYSGARDNPYNPPEYLQTLEMLTGELHDRLVKGLWVLAEGAIYKNFSVELNVSESAEYDPALPIWWAVDDGYSRGAGRGTESYHPRVVIFMQLTARGGLNIFNELYRVEEVEETTIQTALDMPDPANPYPKPERCYIDSSAAQLRGRLWNMGLNTIAATHPVSEGTKNLRRMLCDAHGQRLIQIHPRCVELIREFQSYRYDNNKIVTAGEPPPLRCDDHGVSCVRYAAWSQRYD